MCDVVATAAQHPLSRRTMLAGAGLAAVALGLGPVTNAEADQKGGKHSRRRTRLVLLGTAPGPIWWETNRYGISSAVVVEDNVYLVDCGEGSGLRLRQAGLGPAGWSHGLEPLRAVFLTHLHSDHVVDYPNLLLFGFFNGLQTRSEPVRVFGPGDRGSLPPVFGNIPEPPIISTGDPTPGTLAMTEHLYRAFANDLNDRIRDNGRPDPHRLFQVSDVELPPAAQLSPNASPPPRIKPFLVFEDDLTRVTATLVDHFPVFPALAYRFDTEDGSITFSGDTCVSDNLIELAAGTDILVHEVIDVAWVRGLFGPPPHPPAVQGLINHLIASHTSIEQVGGVAQAAGAKKLVLSHFAPATNPRSRWLEAQRGYSGKLVVGDDLMEIGVGRRRASR